MPDWAVEVYATFLSKEPAPIERLEFMVAEFIAIYANSKKKKNAKAFQPSDFLHFKDAFKGYVDPDVQSDINTFKKAFASRLVIAAPRVEQ